MDVLRLAKAEGSIGLKMPTKRQSLNDPPRSQKWALATLMLMLFCQTGATAKIACQEHVTFSAMTFKQQPSQTFSIGNQIIGACS